MLADGGWQAITLRPDGYWETYHRGHNGIHQMIQLNTETITWELYETHLYGMRLAQASNKLERLLETANTLYTV